MTLLWKCILLKDKRLANILLSVPENSNLKVPLATVNY